MKDGKSNLFVCYSLPLRDFLISSGLRYEIIGLNPKTHKTFWVFIRCNELNKKLDKWKLSMPI